MNYSLAELHRLLENIVRMGTVFAVDTTAAKVRVKDSQGWESNWINWGVKRAGDDRDWEPYSEGEQVVVLCPNGDTAQAIVLCSLNSNDHPAPSNDADIISKLFRGGISYELNKEEGTITLNLPTKIIINANVELNGDLNQDGTHISTGDQVAGEISQISHTHKQNDGNDAGGGVNTSAAQ
ncbi:phage baseplate assembly protein V [Maricurvus nonylphenolicus]|uniref:phage baseplate assembly protein V n=1 Tax=Maricurvus nonylphenolicus TaxID=1008307 RepID=UPI0036F3B6A7